MGKFRLADSIWLWGMKRNVLQETEGFRSLGFAISSMTVEDAIRRTGIRNVIMAGGLPIDLATMQSMASAQRSWSPFPSSPSVNARAIGCEEWASIAATTGRRRSSPNQRATTRCPSVRVPVLSRIIRPERASCSRASPPLIRIPDRAARPRLLTATGPTEGSSGPGPPAPRVVACPDEGVVVHGSDRRG